MIARNTVKQFIRLQTQNNLPVYPPENHHSSDVVSTVRKGDQIFICIILLKVSQGHVTILTSILL